MLAVTMIHMIAAVFAPLCVRRYHRRAFLLLSLIPLAGFIWTLTYRSRVLTGPYPRESISWVPQLGVSLDFRMDTLSWVMGSIVTAIGALVLMYSSRYFSQQASGMGRFLGFFLAFAGAMYGLVTTDNTLMLYLFWECTTVFSFMLIGHGYAKQASRRAALQAITITTFGGLAMLAGLIILGETPGGSYSLSELVYSAQSRVLIQPHNQVILTVAAVLILFGAMSKSALFPFHLWLPAAMAAPTPVSAYLHAAAMVKAGVYLVARLSPGLSDLATWRYTLLIFGIGTMIFGGVVALRQFDLKLLAAYGTVSQLGFLTALVGYGTGPLALAGLTLVLSHSIFKACLFLTVGAVDRSVGTRDLRQLSGLGKQSPGLALSVAGAVASMAGIPITVGYLGKEAVLHAFIESGTGLDWLAIAGITVGSVFTLAYGLRFLWGAFAVKPNVNQTQMTISSRLLLTPPILLGAVSLILGFLPGMVETHLVGYSNLYCHDCTHLALWTGFSLPLLITVGIASAGLAVFIWLGRRMEISPPRSHGAALSFRLLLRELHIVASRVTSFFQKGSLPLYLQYLIATLVVVMAASLIVAPPTTSLSLRLADSPTQALISAIIIGATWMAANARRRIKALLLLGFVGYGIALIFALQGSPDLALTQAVVETVSLIVMILVFRRLPAYFDARPRAKSRWIRALISLIGAVMITLGIVIASSARIHEPVTVDYPQEVFEFGYGRNIVNVTLVDTRAWDTLGEISVLLAAATGVASLIFIRRRYIKRRAPLDQVIASAKSTPAVWSVGQEREIPQSAMAKLAARERTQTKDLRASSRGRTWLPASATLAPSRRSLIFEVGARLIFPALIVFSIFLLFSGHNNPGGGFAGGIVAGIAFALRYLAGGRFELAAAAPLHPGHLLGAGMITATISALAPVLLGGTILQTTVFHFTVPVFAEVHLATALFFDIGVYLIVIGLVLDLIQALGAELDRHAESRGSQAPELSPYSNKIADDDPHDDDPKLSHQIPQPSIVGEDLCRPNQEVSQL